MSKIASGLDLQSNASVGSQAARVDDLLLVNSIMGFL